VGGSSGEGIVGHAGWAGVGGGAGGRCGGNAEQSQREDNLTSRRAYGFNFSRMGDSEFATSFSFPH